MAEWLVWAVWVFGLTYLGVGAAITAWPRGFAYELLQQCGALGRGLSGVLACAPCFSFWVGLAVGLPDNAILARLLPVVAISSPAAVLVSGHVVAGVVAVGLVSAFQFASKVTIAELGE